MAIAKKSKSIMAEVRKVESYEYLLVEYLKEISNEMTYLVLMICSLFLFVLIDLIPATTIENPTIVKMVFVVLICGGFALYGLSSVTKRRIEQKFERMFR
jgi:uncharacterized membrane protein